MALHNGTGTQYHTEFAQDIIKYTVTVAQGTGT